MRPPGSSTCNVEPGGLPFPAQRWGASRETGPDLAVRPADRRPAARSWVHGPGRLDGSGAIVRLHGETVAAKRQKTRCGGCTTLSR